jgi:hypothetical protein
MCRELHKKCLISSDKKEDQVAILSQTFRSKNRVAQQIPRLFLAINEMSRVQQSGKDEAREGNSSTITDVPNGDWLKL